MRGWVLLGGLGWGMGLGAPGPDGHALSGWVLLGGLGWGMGLGAPGPDGQALPGTAQNPARLVYRSAALVASLRGTGEPLRYASN